MSRGLLPVGRPVRVFAVVFVGYVIGAWFSWKVFGTATTAAFFPPAGVSVAAMLLTRRALWPVIVAAIVFGELLVDLRNGFSVPVSAGLALGNVVEPLVGASLVRAGCGGAPDLRRLRDLMIYVAGAAVAGPLVGGVVGGGAAWWLEGAPWIDGVLRWFAGDAIGGRGIHRARRASAPWRRCGVLHRWSGGNRRYRDYSRDRAGRASPRRVAAGEVAGLRRVGRTTRHGPAL